MPAEVQDLLVRNLYDVFDERDPDRRRSAIAHIFTSDCRFLDPRSKWIGRRELNDAVASLHAEFPGYRFSHIGAADFLTDCGKLAWAFGPPEDLRRITGLDFGIIADGRISALYTFIDGPEG